MAESIFLDANFLIAIHKTNDQLHQNAMNLANIIDKNNLEMVTSNYVILEVLTVLSQRISKSVAIKASNLLLSKDSPITQIHINSDLDNQTLELFKTIKNKNISYVDCSIIAVMKSENIKLLATFDKKDFNSLQKIHSFKIYP